MKVLIIGAGGFLGSIARYLTYRVVSSQFIGQFPLGTLIINSAGCFVAGLIFAMAERMHPHHQYLIPFAVTGFLGAYTTFSTFGVETFDLLRGQQTLMAIFNIGIEVILGLVMVGVGRLVGAVNFL